MITLKESVEKAKAILVEKLTETDLRKMRLHLSNMVSVVELGEALDEEISDRCRRREVGVGPFYGESQNLVILTEECYPLYLEAVHVVELFIGVSYVVKVWEEEGKVHPSRIVYGRIEYFGPERRDGGKYNELR